MIIDWLEYENKEHVLSWFLLEAMSFGKTDITKKFGDFDSSKLDVKLTVNGIEVPIEGPMNFLQEQLDVIRKDAEIMGRKKLHDEIKCTINDIIDDFVGDFTDKLFGEEKSK